MLSITRDITKNLTKYDKIAVSRREGTGYKEWFYIDFYNNVISVASFLQNSKHFDKSNKVAILSENRPEWMMTYLGITYNGIWAVPFDANLSVKEVKNLLAHAKPDMMFVSLSIYNKLSKDPEVLKMTKLICFDTLAKEKNILSFDEVLEEGSKYTVEDVDVSEDDVASLIYTSGTTGSPKGVMLMHKNFCKQIPPLLSLAPMYPNDVSLSVLPLHHVFEFICDFTMLYLGSEIVYSESLKPNVLLKHIADKKVTVLIGIPLLFEKIYNKIEITLNKLSGLKGFIIRTLLKNSKKSFEKTRTTAFGKKWLAPVRKQAGLSSIRFFLSGAGPLSPRVALGFAGLGFDMVNGYGLTETAPVISVNPLPVVGKAYNESIGLVLPNMKVQILDPDKEGNGEIIVTGSNVMKGYYKNEEQTKEAFTADGWFKTGDIGTFISHDNKDYLYITGRKKNLIVTSGGKNVYPEEIETLLNYQPTIAESLVLGVPESKDSQGEVVAAYILPDFEYLKSENISLDMEKAHDFYAPIVKEVNANLRPYQKIVKFIVKSDDFDKNSSQKIKRFVYNGSDFQS